MFHLEANSSVQGVIATTLDFCIECCSALNKPTDSYVVCLRCNGAICNDCTLCACDLRQRIHLLQKS